jgi:hypothetical protein
MCFDFTSSIGRGGDKEIRNVIVIDNLTLELF